MPHSGLGHLGWCHERESWLVTHTETQEQAALPAGSWQIAFDIEGFAYLVDANDIEDTEIELERYLHRKLAEAQDGRRLIVAPPDASGNKPKVFLDTCSLQFDVHEVDMKIGPTRRDHRLTAASFRRPRGGFKWVFSLIALYSMLGFDMFVGVSSRWAWQSIPSFQRRVTPIVSGQVRSCARRASPSRSSSATWSSVVCLGTAFPPWP